MVLRLQTSQWIAHFESSGNIWLLAQKLTAKCRLEVFPKRRQENEERQVVGAAAMAAAKRFQVPALHLLGGDQHPEDGRLREVPTKIDLGVAHLLHPRMVFRGQLLAILPDLLRGHLLAMLQGLLRRVLLVIHHTVASPATQEVTPDLPLQSTLELQGQLLQL